jgi:hypothetical protein
VFFFGACKSTVFSITGIVLFPTGYSDMRDPEKAVPMNRISCLEIYLKKQGTSTRQNNALAGG